MTNSCRHDLAQAEVNEDTAHEQQAFVRMVTGSLLEGGHFRHLQAAPRAPSPSVFKKKLVCVVCVSCVRLAVG